MSGRSGNGKVTERVAPLSAPWLRELTLSGECWFGGQISRQICAHHRRRLRKLGWEQALDAGPGGWAAGSPPPRAGNAVEVLIDGAAALPAIAQTMRAAESYVHVSGWYFTPGFALIREGEQLVLRELLAELAERLDVRVLAWAGAPLPLFRPSRSDVRRMRDQMVGSGSVRFELDAKERPLHCHHEKTIVVDGRVAFVGGIDLTSESGDRFDGGRHPPRAAVGWHDVCARIEGPAVADVASHFAMRWHEVTGEQLPAAPQPEPAGDVELQVVRTVPEHIYTATWRGDFSILESYVRAFRAAERFIYLENQFLWSPEISAILVAKLKAPPSPDFRLLLVLPAKPNSGSDDTRGVLGELIEADAGAGRILACTLFAPSAAHADPIYVHAKVGVIDDAWLTIGSANLNEHSMFNDTEMNLVSHDPRLARDTRLRLWAEHLELSLDEIAGEPAEVIDRSWRPIAEEQFRRRAAGEPLSHRLVLLPNVSRRSGRALGPISGLVVDG